MTGTALRGPSRRDGRGGRGCWGGRRPGETTVRSHRLDGGARQL